MTRKSVARGAFAVVIAAALGFGGTQAFAGETRARAAEYCNSLECHESCTLFGDYTGGYCERDSGGYLRCFCY